MIKRKYKGKEHGHPVPLTKAWLSKGLARYVNEDEFGVYVKEGKRIPIIYKPEYRRCIKHRQRYMSKNNT